MKFLFDQSADFRLIAHLRELGHDVTAVPRNYPHSLADEDILAIARQEQRILLVADSDFGELIFHQGLAHTCIVFFRLPGAALQIKIDHRNTVIEEHAEELAAGKFLTTGIAKISARAHGLEPRDAGSTDEDLVFCRGRRSFGNASCA